ncbi:MAG TPA: restriction endonuclease [Candidatus Acidoferrum sp.]|nr:restriction endonuclease [Candidatus Acidoferrum sp.]
MMAPIVAATIQGFIDAGRNGNTTAVQGRALEDLICYVMQQIPGVAITHRNELNAFETEEIDVAVWNDGPGDGLFFLPNIILIECKNWSHRVGGAEVNWFDSKLRSRGLAFGILVTTLGITGEAADVTAAHAIVAAALREGRKLVVLTTDELLATGNTEDLIRLIKRKLCDLAVKGTVA